MASITESDYLREDLGPALAKGLAAVAIARPQNPTEYLALWLLHFLQERTRKEEAVKAAKALESEREDWAKGRAVRERQATTVIQREWRAHVRLVEDRKQKEASLREIFAAIEEGADEENGDEGVPYGATEEGEATEAEREIEGERAANFAAFKRAQLFVGALDKSNIGDLKAMTPENNASAVIVLRCCLYAQGAKASAVDTLDKIKARIKPHTFGEWVRVFDPVGSPPANGRALARVRRLLTKVNEEEIKSVSAALHALFMWLRAASLYRHWRDEHIRLRREAGKETGEDEVEDADEEGAPRTSDDIDPLEEEVKAAEEEEKRLAEEARAAEEQEEAMEDDQ